MDSNSDFELEIKSQQEQSHVQEAREEEEVAEQMDRISDLPDHIIAQVLSFLDTKEAIRTCLLSSRWRYTWIGINRICLDGYKSDPNNFVNLVDHVLKTCSSTKFSSFELYYPNTTDLSPLNPLIQRILTHNIEELIIHGRGEMVLEFFKPKPLLPKCILSCTTLVALKLDYLDIQIPDSIVCFPHLQSIDLGLMFPNYGMVNRLLCRCPILKELFLFGFLDSPEPEGLIINISVSTLRRLALWITDVDYFKRNECNIIIDTPNLKYLSIDDASSARYVVKDLARLENVVVDYEGRPLVPDKVPHLLGLLSGITATEGLKLQWHTLDVLNSAVNYTWPVFPHLKKLIMNMNLSLNYGWTWFSKVLHSTPHLEVLVLDLEWVSDGHLNWWWTLPDSVPNCVSGHLKVIEIQSFKRDEDLLQAVEYLLNNAQVLELLMIDFKQNTVDEEIVNRILMFPKASEACCIQIYPRYD